MQKLLEGTMCAVLVIVCLSAGYVFGSGGLTVFAQAQDAPKNTPAPTATPAPVKDLGFSKSADEKDKPIIVTRVQILESENLALKLQNAQLAATAAIPAELKKAVDEAQKALDEFYEKKIGVSRTALSQYEISDGVDGALILRKKPPVAPTAEKK